VLVETNKSLGIEVVERTLKEGREAISAYLLSRGPEMSRCHVAPVRSLSAMIRDPAGWVKRKNGTFANHHFGELAERVLREAMPQESRLNLALKLSNLICQSRILGERICREEIFPEVEAFSAGLERAILQFRSSHRL